MKKRITNPILICALCLIVATSTGCVSQTVYSDNSENAADLSQTGSELLNKENQEQVNNFESTQANSLISRKYVREDNDVIFGEEVSFETSYTFFEENNGVFCVYYDIGGVRSFTYDEKKIYYCDGTSYDYTIEGDVLNIEGEDGLVSFEKKVETGPIYEGDFSEFEGTYKTTSNTNDSFGGGDIIPDVILNSDGIITGGYDTDILEMHKENNVNTFENQKPIYVTKWNDGSYYCVVSFLSDSFLDEEGENCGGFVELAYRIYPQNSNSEFASYSDYSNDYVYIQLYEFGGGVYNPVFYKSPPTQ